MLVLGALVAVAFAFPPGVPDVAGPGSVPEPHIADSDPSVVDRDSADRPRSPRPASRSPATPALVARRPRPRPAAWRRRTRRAIGRTTRWSCSATSSTRTATPPSPTASITELFAGTLDSAKLIPALGNHDVQSREQDDILAKLGRDSAWYAEQVGPVRVIALDSNRVGDKAQLAWLREELAKKQPPDSWTITAMHHPAYSAGDHGSTKSSRGCGCRCSRRRASGSCWPVMTTTTSGRKR